MPPKNMGDRDRDNVTCVTLVHSEADFRRPLTSRCDASEHDYVPENLSIDGPDPGLGLDNSVVEYGFAPAMAGPLDTAAAAELDGCERLL